jgi:hypothetical protein
MAAEAQARLEQPNQELVQIREDLAERDEELNQTLENVNVALNNLNQKVTLVGDGVSEANQEIQNLANDSPSNIPANDGMPPLTFDTQSPEPPTEKEHGLSLSGDTPLAESHGNQDESEIPNLSTVSEQSIPSLSGQSLPDSRASDIPPLTESELTFDSPNRTDLTEESGLLSVDESYLDRDLSLTGTNPDGLDPYAPGARTPRTHIVEDGRTQLTSSKHLDPSTDSRLQPPYSGDSTSEIAALQAQNEELEELRHKVDSLTSSVDSRLSQVEEKVDEVVAVVSDEGSSGVLEGGTVSTVPPVDERRDRLTEDSQPSSQDDLPLDDSSSATPQTLFKSRAKTLDDEPSPRPRYGDDFPQLVDRKKANELEDMPRRYSLLPGAPPRSTGYISQSDEMRSSSEEPGSMSLSRPDLRSPRLESSQQMNYARDGIVSDSQELPQVETREPEQRKFVYTSTDPRAKFSDVMHATAASDDTYPDGAPLSPEPPQRRPFDRPPPAAIPSSAAADAGYPKLQSDQGSWESAQVSPSGEFTPEPLERESVQQSSPDTQLRNRSSYQGSPTPPLEADFQPVRTEGSAPPPELEANRGHAYVSPPEPSVDVPSVRQQPPKAESSDAPVADPRIAEHSEAQSTSTVSSSARIHENPEPRVAEPAAPPVEAAPLAADRSPTVEATPAAKDTAPPAEPAPPPADQSPTVEATPAAKDTAPPAEPAPPPADRSPTVEEAPAAKDTAPPAEPAPPPADRSPTVEETPAEKGTHHTTQ